MQENSFNFKLAGFSLKQKVGFYSDDTITGEPAGKEGVNLLFRQLDASTEQIIFEEKLQSGQNGWYSFEDVMPGLYEIEVVNPGASNLVFKNTKIRCNFSWDKGQDCKGTIQVYGTPLSGKAVLHNSPSVNNVVALKSKSGLEIKCQNNQTMPQVLKDAVSANKNLLDCWTLTDSQGNFEFESIPLGTYNLHFIDSDPNGIKFDQPDHTIKHTLGNASNIFGIELDGFVTKLVGRTITESGKGIKGVVIKLDGENVATTDSQGEFHLKNVKLDLFLGRANFARSGLGTTKLRRSTLISPSRPSALESMLVTFQGKILAKLKLTMSSSAEKLSTLRRNPSLPRATRFKYWSIMLALTVKTRGQLQQLKMEHTALSFLLETMWSNL